MRDSRNKRSKVNIITKRFFDTLKRENKSLPMFDANRSLVRPYASLHDDRYSNEMLKRHAPNDGADVADNGIRGLVAKSVNGNGNCLFNSASVILIGIYNIFNNLFTITEIFITFTSI